MNGDNKTNWTIGIIVAFVIGLGLGWIIWGGEKASEKVTTEIADEKSDVATETATLEASAETVSGKTTLKETTGGGLITVENQSAGTAVVVKQVQFDVPSWIAIREEREGGLGNILGAAWLPEGTHENVDIELLRGIIPSGTYYAVIFTDDGDKIFNYKKDTMLTNDKGVITAKFNALAKE